MSKFTERLKQSLDSRLPHFSTSIPYIVATILIMLVPLTVVLTQQETRTRSKAQTTEHQIYVSVVAKNTKAPISNAHVTAFEAGGLDIVSECDTNENGTCPLSVEEPKPFEPDKIYRVGATKDGVSANQDVAVSEDENITPTTIVLDLQQQKGTLPTTTPPGSKEYKVTITVRDDQSGKLISGAFVPLDRGGGGGCTTHAEGICAFTVYKERHYQLHVEKEGYADRDTTISVKSSETNINIDMVQKYSKQPPPADDTEDPDTGGPNDTDTPDDGSNPPGPDDLGCLGSCETPTPTPPYCITPAPRGDTPPDTGTPPPDAQSIFDLVRQRINETFSRFGDFFNINPKPPPSP